MHLEGEEAGRFVLLLDLVLLLPTKTVLVFLDLEPENRRAADLSLTAIKAGPFEKEEADRLVLLPYLVLLLRTKRVL